ncbi:MAG TPA: hypothetical protein VHO90_01020 [Bacteroidales bacterium]|nr:hypothetical protein [Bacteroidales bacterium]
MGLALTNKSIDKYFSFLSKLDNSTKKTLIVKLTQSLEHEKEIEPEINDLFNAWADTRSSDEIVKEIKSSRVPTFA